MFVVAICSSTNVSTGEAYFLCLHSESVTGVVYAQKIHLFSIFSPKRYILVSKAPSEVLISILQFDITMTSLSQCFWCSMSTVCCRKPGLPGGSDTSGTECLLITQPTLTTRYWPR